MSAFLCSDGHTVGLAHAMIALGIAESNVVELAQSLRDANNRALFVRYKDEPTPLGPVTGILNAQPVKLNIPRVNGAARMFLYQCAEGDVLETHPACKLLQTLIEKTGGQRRDAEWNALS